MGRKAGGGMRIGEGELCGLLQYEASNLQV